MATDERQRFLGGKYRLLREIGDGAYGVVYEAENTWTGRRVAVKTLHRAHAANAEVTRRFLREARAASRLSHPHVVDVIDLGDDADTGELYLVQALLVGTDLETALERRGRMRPAEALDILVPVMGALAAIHGCGIVHRDVKPSNILLARDHTGRESPTLIDFGIAKFVELDAHDPRTASGILLGTPLYMSPEQARGASDVDARADVWAVGVILYELLTGENPFAAPNAVAVLRRVREHIPPRVDQVVPVAAPLAEIVARAREPDRDRRFPSMQSMLEAVLACETLDKHTTGETLTSRHRAALEAVVVNAQGEPVAVHLVRTKEPRAEEDPRRGLVRFAFVTVAVWFAAAEAGSLAGRALRSSARYEAHVQTHPATATIELDGRPVATGSWSGTLARDGSTHTLRVAASGHVTRTLRFCDAPPPARVTLRSSPPTP
jgi:serine/threonine protein kinase